MSGENEPIYEGQAGGTSTENVHVRVRGTLRGFAIYRGVNVATDPHLRELVLSGGLHTIEGEGPLACTFVYHDPVARKLALVIPEVLRHEELKERARFLRRLARDPSVIPRYAAEARTVIGIAGLTEYLSSTEPSERDDINARESALAARERRIRERAEEVTRLEDELARMREEFAAERAGRVHPGGIVTDEDEEFEELSDPGGTSPLIRASLEDPSAELIEDEDIEEEIDDADLESSPMTSLEVRGDTASDLHDAAHRAILAFQHDVQPLPDEDGDSFSAMTADELVSVLESSEGSASKLADAICRAVRHRSSADLLRVLPRIDKLGDDAGDALIDGLGAPTKVARQAFALALGQLKLRRAVVPLVHLLSSEPTDVWKEIARIYGTFGAAGVRTLLQRWKERQVSEERCVLTLAHLSNHGCESQVRALLRDPDPGIAALAKQAEAIRDEARRQDAIVSGSEAFDVRDETFDFSRRFVLEREGARDSGLFLASSIGDA